MNNLNDRSLGLLPPGVMTMRIVNAAFALFCTALAIVTRIPPLVIPVVGAACAFFARTWPNVYWDQETLRVRNIWSETFSLSDLHTFALNNRWPNGTSFVIVLKSGRRKRVAALYTPRIFFFEPAEDVHNRLAHINRSIIGSDLLSDRR